MAIRRRWTFNPIWGGDELEGRVGERRAEVARALVEANAP